MLAQSRWINFDWAKAMLLGGTAARKPSLEPSGERMRMLAELEAMRSSPVLPLFPVVPPSGNVWDDLLFWNDALTWED
jgi:hypothetical protein